MRRSGTLGWICGRIRGRRYIMFLLIALNGVSSALGVYFAFLSKSVIDAATSRDMKSLLAQSVIAVSVILAEIMLSYLSAYIEERSTASLDRDLKQRVFSMIIRKDYASVTAYHSGDLMTRLTDDVSVISANVLTLVPAVFGFAVTLVLALIGLLELDLKFGLIFLIGGALFLIAVRVFGRYLKGLHKRVQSAVSKGNSFFQETIANLLMIKVFGIEDRVGAIGGERQNNVRRARIRRSNVHIVSYMGASLLFSIGSLYALIWSAYKLSLGLITFGTLTAILQLVNRVQSPVAAMTGVIPRVFSILASAERIMEIENLPDEENCAPRDRAEYYRGFSELRFSDVSFSYDKLPVIKNADFAVKRGSFAVIGGHSGIGKSTLLKLLLGVYKPDGGSVSVTVGGERLEAGPGTRALFAYVPQGNMILSGTIRGTLTMVRPDASDEELWRAAEISCAKEFLEQLPDGLNTEIGENGLGLSEGQVQRLAITRAVLSGAGVLLLDEATSALDEKTEAELLSNLKSLEDKTCIIVSHKPSAFKVCDTVITLSGGNVNVKSIGDR